jgi:hypothetical protein
MSSHYQSISAIVTGSNEEEHIQSLYALLWQQVLHKDISSALTSIIHEDGRGQAIALIRPGFQFSHFRNGDDMHTTILQDNID